MARRHFPIAHPNPLFHSKQQTHRSINYDHQNRLVMASSHLNGGDHHPHFASQSFARISNQFQRSRREREAFIFKPLVFSASLSLSRLLKQQSGREILAFSAFSIASDPRSSPLDLHREVLAVCVVQKGVRVVAAASEEGSCVCTKKRFVGMARRVSRHRRVSSRRLRSNPYPLPSHHARLSGKADNLKKSPLVLERKDWKDATCSVCMEFPHNAVLLLCSSHDKGCRPYMCGTSYRHSNCLDQFKKAYAKGMPSSETNTENPSLNLVSLGWPICKKPEGLDLACPLCRGQVKGWTVVEPARAYLNKKRRTCMQDNCSFIGTYKELQKHVRVEHPRAKPRTVDPVLEQKWRMMEHQREREDVLSTLRATNPRSRVVGDYVIEMDSDTDTDDEQHEGDRIFRPRRHVSQSIVYFLVQEGARLARFDRDNEASDGIEDGGGGPSMDGSFGMDADPVYHHEGDDDAEARREMFVDILRSERRRRHRSQGRLTSGVS